MKERIIRIFECKCRREDYVFLSTANHRPVCPDHHELQLSKIRTCWICEGTEEVSNHVNQVKFHCPKCRYPEKLKKTAEGNAKRERQSIGKKVEGVEDAYKTPWMQFCEHLDKKFKLPPVYVMGAEAIDSLGLDPDEVRRICNG